MDKALALSAPLTIAEKLLRTSAFLGLMFFLPGRSSSQVKYDFPQFWRETGSFFSMPAHWDAMDWATLAMITGMATVASGIELPARDIKFIDRNFYYSPEAEGGRIYGELYTPF